MKLRHLLASLLVQLFASFPMLASPIVPANDGVGSQVIQNGQTFNITGGTQAGANLFHSLQKFGLDANQIANFLSRPDIANILTRVVGGEASFINGLIQVTGGNSNLYLMNPAGIIFGANASLNVPAGFTATTANAIQVGNGYFSINSTVDQIRQLNGTVNGFAFSSLNTSFDNKPSQGVILNQGNLTGSAGNAVVLLGGIVINTGTVETPHGKIIISALPDGKYVRVTTEGGLVSYDLPIAENQDLRVAGLRPIQASDFPALLTGRSVGTTEVSGTVSTASSTVNRDSVIFISGESIKLSNAILNNDGTDGLIKLQISTSTPVTGFTFLDRVRNYEQIANTLTAGNQLILLSRNDNGIAKVNQVLEGKTGIQNLQFVSDGNAGQIWLGRDFISNDTLANYEAQISNWKQALAPSADILFFTCNLAKTADGQLLLTRIENLTNANIAASTDITGNMAYNGNWTLEYGTVNTQPSFDLHKLQFADVKLAIFTVTNTLDAIVPPAGSLRDAINQANLLPGADVIAFAPATNGTPISLNSGQLVVTDAAGLTITGNGASNTIIDGGGVDRVFNANAGNIIFDGVTIRNGTTAGNGAGILSNNGNVTLTNSVVSNNTAGLSGGGIRALNGNVTLNNSRVSNNKANGGVTNGGGGIRADGNVTLNNSTVSDNISQWTGGGIRATGDVILNNSEVSVNQTIQLFSNGGGISTSGNVILNNSTVSGNTGNYSGGGIRAVGNVILNNSSVSGNIASNFTGGGIAANGDVTLINSTVLQNSSFSSGGGIIANGNVTLTNSTVSGNTATDDNGGGIASFSNVALINSTVSNNEARGLVFGDGGGIITGPNGDVILINSTVSGNRANLSGGGIRSLGTGTVTLTNSTVSGNTAGVNGGGIFANNGGTIRNSTIAFNSANNGGGIYRNGGTIDIGNTIVAKNTAVTSPDIGSNVIGTGYTNAGHNLIGDNTGFAGIFTNGVSGTIVGVDPLLAPLAFNGGSTQTHALLPNSPAINAGNNALIPVGVTTDQRGVSRILFTTVDIGAFELQVVLDAPPEVQVRTDSRGLFCTDWNEFVPVDYQGTVIKVPIQKCNDSFSDDKIILDRRLLKNE